MCSPRKTRKPADNVGGLCDHASANLAPTLFNAGLTAQNVMTLLVMSQRGRVIIQFEESHRFVQIDRLIVQGRTG